MSGGSKVQTTRSEPWEEQKPYLIEGFRKAEELSSAGKMEPAYYGTTLDPEDLLILNCMHNRLRMIMLERQLPKSLWGLPRLV